MADTDDLDAQIAALQALKAARIAAAEDTARRAAREKENVLVDATPNKKRVLEAPPPSPPKPPALRPGFTSGKALLRRPPEKPTAQPAFSVQPARASSLAAALARRRSQPKACQELPTLKRSSGFGERTASERPTSAPASTSASTTASASAAGSSKTAFPSRKGKEKAADDDELEIVRDGTERDSNLTVLDDLKLGPGEFGLDPEGEEVWRNLEPNSGIRLLKRELPHADLQDHLYGRYHLRPPQIYSVARLSRDGATYDIPVDGDWVTIAVVAERSDVRISGTREYVSEDEEDEEDEEEDGEKKKGKEKEKEKEKEKKNTSKLAQAKNKGKEENKRKRRPRKYINLKLVALPPRSKTLGSGSSVAGDALLHLLLFESDSIVRMDDGEGGTKRDYRGGSGGAYERWCNLAVGSVIAILNPRVLRPLKSGASPHPLTLPLALNPQSGDSIQLIGHAMDLGRCSALQRDGNRCRTWVDTRLSSVCEYHVHAAVKRGRSSRAELASATTSFELQERPKSRRFGNSSGGGGAAPSGDFDTYNPRLKRGLLPSGAPRAAPRGPGNGGGGATYIVGSGIARTDDSDAKPSFGDSHLAERIGRSQAQRRKRKMEEAETEAALTKLFERSDDGSVGAQYLAALGHGPVTKEEEAPADRKRVFHAAAIKLIGFDPTGVQEEDADKKKVAASSLKEASNRPLKLGRLAGPMRLSNVVVPLSAQKSKARKEEEDMIDLD